MFSKKIVTFSISAELKNYNAGQGRHWGMTHAEKARMQRAVKIAGIDECVSFPFDRKVDIVVTRVLGKGQRFWDQDSVLRGNAKQLIDSLVDAEVLNDDSIKWIGRCLGDQDASRREAGPITEVTFYEHDE